MKILKLPVDDRSGLVSIEIGIQRENSLDPTILTTPTRLSRSAQSSRAGRVGLEYYRQNYCFLFFRMNQLEKERIIAPFESFPDYLSPPVPIPR